MYKLLAGVMLLAAVSFGDMIKTYEFKTNGLNSLAHEKAYSWGINLELASNEVITGATLKISNVSNWKDNEWNALWIDLLKDAPTGIKSYADANKYGSTDYFAPAYNLDRLHWNMDYNPWNGVNDGLYSNRGGTDKLIAKSKNNTVNITFSKQEVTMLSNYLKNKDFGIGVDADCHFYTSGFKFVVTTKTPTTKVPEPTLISLLGFGLFGLALYRRKN